MRLRQLKKYCKMILFDKSTYKINYLKKLAMNLSGFTADQYIRFNFESNDKKEYISEIERWETRKINGRYNIVFDDKLLFYEIFKQYLNVPVNYGWISNGKIYDLDGNVFTDDKFLSFMQSKKKLIIKPVITI